jgi:hypothetical protein
MWSWSLSIIGLLGAFITGRKYWWGWAIMSFYNALWIIYALVSKQFGFLLASAVYQIIYAKSLIEWRRQKN